MIYYLQGLLLGLAYVAPIGMQNMFVINSALTQKQHRALITAFIVIFFDITLTLGCFFGIGSLMTMYPALRTVVLLAGGALVIYIGCMIYRANVSVQSAHDTITLPKTITTACAVTWFNPQALIDGTMMLGAVQAALPAEGILNFLFGAISASGLWFIGITLFISAFSRSFTPQLLGIVNKICGIAIMIYGIKIVTSFFNV